MSSAARPFAPRYWGVHLLALVLVTAAGWLGLWQLDAWQTRRAAEAVDLTQVAPEPLAEVLGADDPFPGDKVGQPVVVTGTWLPEETFSVSGRSGGPEGDEGSWMVTPLVVDGGDAALLVVRGWTVDPGAAAAPPTGAAALVGWLQPTDGSVVPDPDPEDDVLPALRVADAAQRLDRDLYGAYVVVAEDLAPGGSSAGDRTTNPGTAGLAAASPAEVPEAGRFTAVRNLLYGVEWWVFGAFAAFIWWRYVRDLRDGKAAQEPGAGPGPDEEDGRPITDGHAVRSES